ncbi:hypothetical protein [Nocardia beijingensis]|nr:hypothetical protein [Nocardia beijingensis]
MPTRTRRHFRVAVLPIPEFNDREQQLTMTRYRRGPSETTPLR